MRRRIIKRALAQPLKPLLRRGLWIGNDAVDGLLPKHIGGMFD
jgi:hypothetical protein